MRFVKCKSFQKGPLNDDGTHNIEDCEIIAERVWFFYYAGKKCVNNDPVKAYIGAQKMVDVTIAAFSERYEVECLCTAEWLASQVDGFIAVHIPDGRKCYINKEKITYLGVYDGMTRVYIENFPLSCTDAVEEVKRQMEE